MSITYLILYILLCLCILKIFVAATCDSFEECDVRKYCSKLSVANGTVCYTSLQKRSWKAVVKCQENFQLRDQLSHRSCYEAESHNWIWSGKKWDSICVPVTEPTPTRLSDTEPSTTTVTEATVETTTSQSATIATLSQSSQPKPTVTTSDGYLDKDYESHLIVYITVPSVVMLSVGVFLFIISLIIIRRRKLSNNGDPSRPAAVTHRNIEGNGCDYDEVVNPGVRPNTIEDGRDYDEIDIDIDTHLSSNVETLCISNDTTRVYSRLHIGDRCNNLGLNDSASVDDALYDHADQRSGMLHSIELNTYAHVSIDLGADNSDNTLCQ